MKSTIQDGEHPEDQPDGRTKDVKAIEKITQQWVYSHMANRANEFTDTKKINLFCGTWNVNAKKQDGGLHDWLFNPALPRVDVYAIGFQEIVDLNAVNVVASGGNTRDRAQFWQDNIAECLNSTPSQYTLVMTKHLVGLLLCVYVEVSLAAHVKDVRATTHATGLMGMMGNKGGVCVRLNIHDSTFCFVCSHLAAHRENCNGRNADFKNILERARFDQGQDQESVEEGSLFSRPTARVPFGSANSVGVDLSIGQHEFVFWMGDLNYRIIESVEDEIVFRKIEEGDLAFLRGWDQLNRERREGRVFQNFNEGVLDFPPTYKFEPGTNLYDKRNEKKIRTPSWCDRVLWRVADFDWSPATAAIAARKARLVNYRSSTLLPSDHKPVSATFELEVRTVAKDRENVVHKELEGKLKQWSRGSTPPAAEVAGLRVDLGDVKYEVNSKAAICIRNTGQTTLPWHFVSKLEEAHICKRWVTVDVTSGLLLPGETANLTLTVFIDKKTAQLLNQARDPLEDVLILRLEDCQDLYVNVSVAYHRSCFGMSLEELVHTTQPVRSTRPPAAEAAADMATVGPSGATPAPFDPFAASAFDAPAAPMVGVGVGAAGRLKVPKEVWRLVDALWSGGAVRERDLFTVPADPAEIAAVRESLDCGAEIGFVSARAVAQCLIALVGSLPKPLFPSSNIHSSLASDANEAGSNKRHNCRIFLNSLPPLNYNLVVYLVAFFREVLAQKEHNRTTPDSMAEVLLSCVTAQPSDADLSREERAGREETQKLVYPTVKHLLEAASI